MFLGKMLTIHRRVIIAMVSMAVLIGVLSIAVALLPRVLPAIGATVDPIELSGRYGSPRTLPERLTDFTLPASTGGRVSLSRLQGRVVLMSFGYTHCPDVCPTTMGDFKQIKAALGSSAKSVVFVFVSVDGERDTPERLRQFLDVFDPSFIGLSGDPGTLGKIKADFGLYYKLHTDEGPNYSVDHSTSIYLIDSTGTLTKVYPYGTDVKVIARGIRRLQEAANAQ